MALTELFRAIPDYDVLYAEARFARTEYVRGWLGLPIEFTPRDPHPPD